MTASVPAESNQKTDRTGKAAFPRSARLLRHADFERVYKLGRRHFSASMTVFYLQREAVEFPAQALKGAGRMRQPVDAHTGLRVGFTVGRALGGAVVRNRMKRRLREAVRLTRASSVASADVVINPKKALLTNDFAAVVNEVRQAFVIIDQKLAGKNRAVIATTELPESRKPEDGSR